MINEFDKDGDGESEFQNKNVLILSAYNQIL